MQCETCGKRPATVHQTVIVNGHKTEHHLCEVCAREQSSNENAFSFPNLSIHQLLSSFLGQDPFGGATLAPRTREEPRCKNCGMTYSEFADGGKLGCSQCYEYLEPHLTPLVKRIHGTTQHTGKAPKRTGGVLRKKRELAQLKQQLAEAVHNEQFEEAAKLRDRIKEMEMELQAGGAGFVVE